MECAGNCSTASATVNKLRQVLCPRMYESRSETSIFVYAIFYAHHSVSMSYVFASTRRSMLKLRVGARMMAGITVSMIAYDMHIVYLDICK